MLDVNFETNENKKNEPKALGKSIAGSIIGLLLVVCLYVALNLTGKLLNSKITAVENQNKVDYSNFLAGKGNDVIDFKNRSLAAKNAISQGQLASDILAQIEKTILPNVYLDSFSYDNKDKSIALKCVGDNFNTEAKQILSFKESGFYSSVVPTSGAYDSEGKKLNFSINLKLK